MRVYNIRSQANIHSVYYSVDQSVCNSYGVYDEVYTSMWLPY